MATATAYDSDMPPIAGVVGGGVEVGGELVSVGVSGAGHPVKL